MKQTNGTCPYCNAKLTNYDSRDWKYGSLVRTCKACGKQYIDKRYHEIAIEGIEPSAMSIKKCWFGMIFGLICAVTAALLTYRSIHLHGYFSSLGVCSGMLGLALAIFMLVDMIRIKTGLKERRYHKLRLESLERLKDKDYVYILLSAGYLVPAEYL